jgi:uncharacterized protein YjbJ (UPF0337 family)
MATCMRLSPPDIKTGSFAFGRVSALTKLRIAFPNHAELLQEGEKIFMKPSTVDQVKGAAHELKGAVKEKAGQVTNNPELQAEGQDETLAGKVQKKVGQVEKVFEK